MRINKNLLINCEKQFVNPVHVTDLTNQISNFRENSNLYNKYRHNLHLRRSHLFGLNLKHLNVRIKCPQKAIINV